SMTPSATSWPAYGYQTHSGYNGAPSAPWGGSEPGAPPYQGGYPQPAGAPYGAYDNSGSQAPPLTAYSLPPLTPELLMIIPRRTALGDQFDQLPRDRRGRMALMLVDGQRPIADLVRLPRRQEQELYAVLAHLEALGLILMRGW